MKQFSFSIIIVLLLGASSFVPSRSQPSCSRGISVGSWSQGCTACVNLGCTYCATITGTASANTPSCFNSDSINQFGSYSCSPAENSPSSPCGGASVTCSVTNCQTCSSGSSSQCQTCNTGYFKKADGTCAAITCSSSFNSFVTSSNQGPVAVTCPSGCVSASASVFGSANEYTDDSSICRAAIQFGVISSATGGSVQIKWLSGKNSYTGSSNNGVTSTNWGSFSGTGSFVAACPSNCQSCSTVSTCTACNSGYTLSSGQCTASQTCQSPNCKTCASGSTSQCQICNPGYTLDGTSCKLPSTVRAYIIEHVNALNVL